MSREGAVEVDLVGADRREPPAKGGTVLGTIKWRENKPVTMADYNALVTSVAKVPGVSPATIKVAVSRLGADADAMTAFDVVLDAGDMLAAWSVR